MSEKVWGGRFAKNTDGSVESFTSSIAFDNRLYEDDIKGSIAHLKTLAKASVIEDDEAKALIKGLKKIKSDIEKGDFKFTDSLEDIHMHIEDALFKEIGKTAQKLHTARSRNDQIALDVRLYLKRETKNIIEKLLSLRKAVVAFSKKNLDVILPGYTHLQRAQPVLLAHHFMAYYEMFKRDYERFSDSLKRTNIMPLGSAALAGTTYPIDRKYTASLLGFNNISANSIDAVSDRDFIIEFLSAASICMMHLSRLSEELIIWSSSEFGFIALPDAFTTGSSIMPQKKNPDVCELVRGKFGRVFGDLAAVLTIMKSLPLAYNRDMQEDKAPLFDAVDTVKSCIDIYIRMIPKIRVNKKVMHNAAAKGYLNSTDFADYLVLKGVNFREAHKLAGKAVAYAIKKKKELNELTIVELKKFSENISEDIFTALDLTEVIDKRKSFGGTATANVAAAIALAEKEIK